MNAGGFIGAALGGIIGFWLGNVITPKIPGNFIVTGVVVGAIAVNFLWAAIANANKPPADLPESAP